MGALVVRICLRLLDRTAKQHENRTTIKAFSQTGEGQIVKKVSLKLLGCMKGPQPLHFYAPRYCLTASAGFGRRFVKSPALSRLWRRY